VNTKKYSKKFRCQCSTLYMYFTPNPSKKTFLYRFNGSYYSFRQLKFIFCMFLFFIFNKTSSEKCNEKYINYYALIGYSPRLDVGLVATFVKKFWCLQLPLKKTKWNLLYIKKRVYFHKNSVWLAYFKYKRVKFVRIYSKIGQKPSFCRKILQTLH